jgi:long-chain acyl-CoA synthetase
VHEFSVPAAAEVPAERNLSDLVYDNAVRTPHRVQFRRKVDGRWQDVTARQFLAEVTDLAKGLMTSGIGPGDRVGIMSRTRYEWTLVDFALWSAGAVPVPIYETSSAEQVEWILADSGAVGCFVEHEEHERTVTEVLAAVPQVRSIWRIDAGALDGLVRAGAEVPDADVEERRRTLTADSLGTLIYTSGTTGRPKGCERTHRNMLADVANVVAGLGPVFGPGKSTLLFIPLAHVFGRLIQVGAVHAGVVLGHTPDAAALLDDLASFRPTFILSVPRVFEKVYNGAQAKATAEGKGRIFSRAAGVAVAYSEGLDAGGAGLGVRLQHGLFDRLVYSKLRERMGGRIEYAVSGGAPLGARLGHFFRGAGITILEGYGLTETSAGATINRPDAIRVGSVGQPIPGGSVRIADDGEILLRGDHVFVGYWRNETATKEALEPDGWFHTGDIGRLDDEGFLFITGRKKELIVTAGGKNVAPAVLEDRLRAHPLISHCMVVGDNRPFIAALVTLDAEALPGWLASHGKPADMPMADVVADPDVLAAVQAAVDDANKAVSHAEAIKKFSLLTEDFTEASGQLTPTLKLRRGVVLQEFAGQVDELYR